MKLATDRPAAWHSGAVATCFAAAILYLILILPNHPAAVSPWALLVFPLEWPVIVAGLLALPAQRSVTVAVRALVVVAILLITLAKFADFLTFVAYNRGFNPIVDGHLIVAAWHFGSGTLGILTAAAVVVAILGMVGVLGLLLWWATGRLAAISLPTTSRPWVALSTVPLAAFAISEIGHAMGRWDLPFEPPGAAFTARVAVERAEMLQETIEGLRTFREAAENDPFADMSPLLDKIGNRDVLLTYVESYGASSLTNPRYAPTHRRTLRRIEADLGNRGLAMRSGWLEAPMIGGQSWLSHATISRGLWIPDQRTYGAALISGRRSLFHIARDAGYVTASIMPAIIMDWPEAEFMGFDRVLTARTLGYEGLPFNWVTMPDQFTFVALERLVMTGAAGAVRPPVFAQIALISSHAPWTPVPELVAWDDVGDGSVFDRVAMSGEAPEVIWRDHDLVRDQFRKAVDYSLQTVGAFAARHADEAPLMIVLGDHQPARFVSEDDSFAVPIHVIGPQHLVDQFADWGWIEGLLPDEDATTWRMDDFRNRFLATFSSGVASP